MPFSSLRSKNLQRIPLVIIAGAMTFILAAPGAAAQTQDDFYRSTERKFFLHLQQYCERGVSLILWIDEWDWPNDLDGCGGLIHETESSWTDVFPAFTPFYGNITTSTTAEFHIFILSRAVDQTTVAASLDFGYASCAGSQGPEIVVQEKVLGFHEFIIPCTFEVNGPAEPVARPNLTVEVTATHTYGYGSEGDHASYFTLTSVTPAPPQDTTEIFEAGKRPLVQLDDPNAIELAELPNATAAGGKSPGFGAAATVVVASVAAVAVARARRT